MTMSAAATASAASKAMARVISVVAEIVVIVVLVVWRRLMGKNKMIPQRIAKAVCACTACDTAGSKGPRPARL